MTVYVYPASPPLTAEFRSDTGYSVLGTEDAEGLIPEGRYHGLNKSSIHSFLSLGLDRLVVCLPLTQQTNQFFGADELQTLSKNCRNPFTKPYNTNTSPGKVVDQDALAAALKTAQIAFAALDVTDTEPLPWSHRCWDIPNNHISPHISCMGREYLPRPLDIVKANLDQMANGERLINFYDRGKQFQRLALYIISGSISHKVMLLQ